MQLHHLHLIMSILQKSESVQVSRNLHHHSGMVVQHPAGHSLMIDQHGDVWIERNGDWFPISESDIEVSNTNRRILKYLPYGIAAGIGLAIFFTATFWLLLPAFPAMQETTVFLVGEFGVWYFRLCATLLTLVAAYILVTIMFADRKKVTRTPSDIIVRDGLAIVFSRNEQDASIGERLQNAIAEMDREGSTVLAVLYVRFQEPTAFYYNRTETVRTKGFDRDNASGKFDLPKEFTGRVFTSETWDEYQTYCDQVEPIVRQWHIRNTYKNAGTTEKLTEAIIRTATAAVFILLLPMLAFTQKSKQVEQYLGTERYQNDKPAGTVNYVFQQMVLERVGDGKFSYAQLLKDHPRYQDADNAGRLISVTVAGKRILPIKAEPTTTDMVAQPTTTTAPTGDPVRPRPAPGAAPSPQSQSISVPDSAQLAANLEHAKDQVTTWKDVMWMAIRPIWRFIMWIFNSVIILLICIGGILRYIAKTAAGESAVTQKGRTIAGGWIVQAQQEAAGFLLLITWIIAVVMLLDVFMWLVWFSWPIWLLLLVWFPTLRVAELLTNWIVPNLRVVKDKI